MSVGGRVTEIRDMTITAGDFPGQPTRVNRLRCKDRHGTETCVYAAWYPTGSGPATGDEVWWTSGRILYDGDRRSVPKIAYSFSPCDDAHQETV